MTVQHINIIDSKRHENKGASTATNGQVLKANGDGTTTFVNPNTLNNSSYTTVVEGSATTSQSPAVVDVPLLVNFGAASTGGDYTLGVDGTLTILTTGVYNLAINLNLGRTTNTGIAILAARILVNDVENGPVYISNIDTSINIQTLRINRLSNFTANDTVKIQVLRDSLGVNDGGLINVPVTLAGWGDSPSAYLKLQRIVGAS